MTAVLNEVRIAMDDMMTIFEKFPCSGRPAPQRVKEAFGGAICHSGSVIHQGPPEQGHAILSDEAFAGVAVGFRAGHGAGGLWP